VNVSPEHTDGIVNSEFSVGLGLTDTVTFCVFVQLSVVRVIAYVTVIGAAVELVSVSVILLPEPLSCSVEVMPSAVCRVHANDTFDVALVGV
jgi:hypothetical protein